MDANIIFGGSIAAAFIAGIIALFAPCCISVMLPAYFANTFQNRRMLIGMTFLFAAGVATIILPITMGAAFLVRFINAQHTLIYITGGFLLLLLAAYVLLGGQIHLPMPGRRAGGKAGPLSTYFLGVFSGIASSCCAPVLAGVIALSAFASSFGLVLLLGIAYVSGMVAPLLLISLLWERYDWSKSRLFRPWSVTWKLGPWQRTLTATGLATGVLMSVMGAGAIWIGLTQDAMRSSGGWQAAVALRLQSFARVLTNALAWMPNWVAALILLTALIFLAMRVMKLMKGDNDSGG
ncbi:cytochrome c biogenesis protein CcdA [uncultured Paenibacillus sp.]|uniref:cytochrome c biogenesis CcdA family protein n=1 Tax=uncultured Paenibacillus sp. TaxID=227322 RepID=UPI0028D61EA9|nr:cytochrome c biogenesis protein CcdA [uncultured Paenibacillus sp.]